MTDYTPEKLEFIKDTQIELSIMISDIIKRRTDEYNKKFGWDTTVDNWLWRGLNNINSATIAEKYIERILIYKE